MVINTGKGTIITEEKFTTRILMVMRNGENMIIKID